MDQFENKEFELNKKTQDIFLELYLKYEKNINLDAFLVSQLVEKKATDAVEEAEDLIKEISIVLEEINQDYQDLVNAKESGISRSQWFQSKLGEFSKQFPIENNYLMESIKSALSNSNNSFAKLLFDDEFVFSTKLIDSQYNDLNKKAIIKDFLTEIDNNTLLSFSSFEKGTKDIFTKSRQDLESLKDYFEQVMDSPIDMNIKKVAAVGTLIAVKNGYIPFLKNKSIDEITMIVDKGLTNAKIAYKVAKGEITVLKALDFVIDRSTSTTKTIVNRVCKKAGGIVGGRIGGVIGSVFGPAGAVVGTNIGTVIGGIAGEKVGNLISKGIEKISVKAKAVVSNVVANTASQVGRTFSKVKNWFS